MNHLRNCKYGMLAVMVSLVSSFAWADSPIQWRGSPGWEPESAYCRLYDAKHVETIQGTVARVEKIVPLEGMGYGVYMMLHTGNDTLPVHLVPKVFVEKQAVQFISVVGESVTRSSLPCKGGPTFLAAHV